MVSKVMDIQCIYLIKGTHHVLMDICAMIDSRKTPSRSMQALGVVESSRGPVNEDRGARFCSIRDVARKLPSRQRLNVPKSRRTDCGQGAVSVRCFFSAYDLVLSC